MDVWRLRRGESKLGVETIRRLNEEVNRAMHQPDVNAKLVTAGLIVVVFATRTDWKDKNTQLTKNMTIVRVAADADVEAAANFWGKHVAEFFVRQGVQQRG
jgi:hypothetical protein